MKENNELLVCECFCVACKDDKCDTCGTCDINNCKDCKGEKICSC